MVHRKFSTKKSTLQQSEQITHIYILMLQTSPPPLYLLITERYKELLCEGLKPCLQPYQILFAHHSESWDFRAITVAGYNMKISQEQAELSSHLVCQNSKSLSPRTSKCCCSCTSSDLLLTNH